MSGKLVTVDSSFSIKEAVAIKNVRFVAVGTDSEMRRWIGRNTAVVNLAGRMMIPGLIDSHMHATVGGLTWNSELRWESVRSLADGLKQIEICCQGQTPRDVDCRGWRLGADAISRETFADTGDSTPSHPSIRSMYSICGKPPF